MWNTLRLIIPMLNTMPFCMIRIISNSIKFLAGLCIFSIICLACRAKKSPKSLSSVDGNSKATVAIIPYSKSKLDLENYKPTDLANSDLVLLDSLIEDFCKEYTIGLYPQARKSFGIDFSLRSYKRQYVPMLNKKGEKIVWANFFCNDPIADWEKEIVHVRDGGNCFFNLKVNLTKRECYEICVNGYATISSPGLIYSHQSNSESHSYEF